MRNDPEKDAVEVNYVPGYPSLAAFIASDPDHSTAIYRRFDRLSARNLLYLQAELVTLEKKQDELDKHDLNADDIDAKDKARNWGTLLARAESGSDDEAKERVQVAKAIREKIKEYSQYLRVWRKTPREMLTVILQEKPSFSNLKYFLSEDLRSRLTRRSTTSSTTLKMAKRRFLLSEGRMLQFMMTEVISWRWLGPPRKTG
jgi:hypothetical protein